MLIGIKIKINSGKIFLDKINSEKKSASKNSAFFVNYVDIVKNVHSFKSYKRHLKT